MAPVLSADARATLRKLKGKRVAVPVVEAHSGSDP